MNVVSDQPQNFTKQTLTFGETGFFSEIVLDYLNDNPKLRPFYNFRPSEANFMLQRESKKASYKHRVSLVEALRGQYSRVGLKSSSIEKLAAENAFTITTGHQVCLFTGPAYFIWKILSVIRTCQHLSKVDSSSVYVPVFWMATEDHDFEEANHFNIMGKHFEWESGQTGAVGRMKPDGLDEIADELEAFLGIGYESGKVLKLFRDSYLKHDNIADATRYLVHSLFSDFGVVVIDGDDPKLKRLMIPFFKDELLQGTSAKAVRDTSEQLSKSYSTQVHPRDINLFYLEQDLRVRIERAGDKNFAALHAPLEWSEQELLQVVEEHPERFSPNVILRPLYQEVVLPNLAYAGGGGELAYWFQLKNLFEIYEVPFPILMLRNSLLHISPATNKRLSDLSLDPRTFFQPRIELENELLRERAHVALKLDSQKEKLEQLFLEIEKQILLVDSSLSQSIKSSYKRALNVLDSLEKKMLRAERRKQADFTSGLDLIFEALFPNGSLQERHINFAQFQLELNDGYFEKILELLDPINPEFLILSQA